MLTIVTQVLALAAFLAGSYGIYRRALETKKRALPADKSPVKGSLNQGVLYAFTAGMMPWAKESTRLHMIAYLRGIGFHIGIFAALGALLISPIWAWLPPLLTTLLAALLIVGSLLGAAGGIMRMAEHGLRGLSLPDDHFAVWLTTAFMAAAALALLNRALLPLFYLVSAVTLVYVPMGKIRHCLYFFFSRIFFGRFFGRRAVFPHPEPAK